MMIYNGLLDGDTLQQLEKCLSNKASNRFAFQKISIGFGIDPILIECFGKLRVTFDYQDGSSIHLDITSLYGEPDIPIVDQGRLKIDLIMEARRTLSERLVNPSVYDFNCTIAHLNMSPIVNIKFFGNHLNDFLNVIDPEIDIDYLNKKYEISGFPRVICDSIEVVVFKHESDKETILILQAGGFKILFYETVVDLMETLLPYNGYGKNFVLQHEIFSKTLT